MSSCRGCPDPDLLADYADELCDPQRQLSIERHLVVCDKCRAQLADERELLQRMRSIPVDHTRHQSMVAGLLSLRCPTPASTGRPEMVRPGPGTVAVSAPPQYVSARRSIACAMIAAAGCLGVALVAAHVPDDDAGVRTFPGGEPAEQVQERVVARPAAQPLVAQMVMIAGAGSQPHR